MFWKKTLPLLIVLVMGILLGFQYFAPHRASDIFLNDFYINWVITIGIFGAVLGYFSFLRVHIYKVIKRSHDWYFSAINLLALLAMIVSAIFDGTSAGMFMNLFTYVSVAVNATVFALLAFYISSAAYRAFRARSMQAVALLIAAIIVMLGRVPIGEPLSFWTHFGINITFYDVSQWILNVPNMAAKRAIALGVGLGSLLVSLKIILGIERSYLGGD